MTDIENDTADNSEDIMKDFNFDDSNITDGDLDADIDISAILENPNEELITETNDNTEDELSAINEITAENNESVEEETPVVNDMAMDTDETQENEPTVDEAVVKQDEIIAEQPIADDETISEDEENSEENRLLTTGVQSENLPFLKWYDNGKNYKTYDIAKNFASGSFTGSEDCDTIHIDVGFDTYGWLVVFADGVTMSLHDVKEYQLRQGCLPFASGRITYGSSVLDFDRVKRIVIYETVKYFSYGA